MRRHFGRSPTPRAPETARTIVNQLARIVNKSPFYNSLPARARADTTFVWNLSSIFVRYASAAAAAPGSAAERERDGKREGIDARVYIGKSGSDPPPGIQVYTEVRASAEKCIGGDPFSKFCFAFGVVIPVREEKRARERKRKRERKRASSNIHPAGKTDSFISILPLWYLPSPRINLSGYRSFMESLSFSPSLSLTLTHARVFNAFVCSGSILRRSACTRACVHIYIGR